MHESLTKSKVADLTAVKIGRYIPEWNNRPMLITNADKKAPDLIVDFYSIAREYNEMIRNKRNYDDAFRCALNFIQAVSVQKIIEIAIRQASNMAPQEDYFWIEAESTYQTEMRWLEVHPDAMSEMENLYIGLSYDVDTHLSKILLVNEFDSDPCHYKFRKWIDKHSAIIYHIPFY